MNISVFIIGLCFGVLSIFALLRFIMQLSRINFYNPIVQFVCRFTDIYCVLPRKSFPSSSRIDIASLLMAYIIQLLGIYFIYKFFSPNMPAMFQIAIWSLLVILGLCLRIYFFSLILTVIFSWVRPQGSRYIMEISSQLISPLLAPFHKFIPPLGGLDFSPMALFFLIYLLQSVWKSFAINWGVPLGIIFGV